MIAQRKILVVDDDVLLREMFTIILEQAGYKVIVASDGASGVELSKSENPDLVIIDGLMPKMHGFVACKTIKQQANPPKVILLSGIYTKPSYKLAAKYEYKADEFLVKPIGPADLLASVEKHLAGLPDRRPESPRLASTEQIELEQPKINDFEVVGLPCTARPAGYSANW